MELQENPRSNLIQEQLAINQKLDKLHNYNKRKNTKLQQIMIILLAIKKFPMGNSTGELQPMLHEDYLRKACVWGENLHQHTNLA